MPPYAPHLSLYIRVPYSTTRARTVPPPHLALPYNLRVPASTHHLLRLFVTPCSTATFLPSFSPSFSLPVVSFRSPADLPFRQHLLPTFSSRPRLPSTAFPLPWRGAARRMDNTWLTPLELLESFEPSPSWHALPPPGAGVWFDNFGSSTQLSLARHRQGGGAIRYASKKGGRENKALSSDSADSEGSRVSRGSSGARPVKRKAWFWRRRARTRVHESESRLEIPWA